MKAGWAEQNLLVIRTLMERATIYRRALGPILLMAGVAGIAAAATGLFLRIEVPTAFVCYWLVVAVGVICGAFFLARRQALRDREAFWSAPTRRVAQALVPPLIAGLIVTALLFIQNPQPSPALAVILWMVFYGVALHAAGFFTPPGLRYLGWLFMVGGLGVGVTGIGATPGLCHTVMGATFGGLHLVYGAYLSSTEKGSNET